MSLRVFRSLAFTLAALLLLAPAPAARARPLGAVIQVTNLNDAGAGSLRQALATAALPANPGADTITFQPGLTGTITLTSGRLNVDSDVTIQGPGADVLTVSGNHASQVFYVAPTVSATITGLTIADGRATGPFPSNVGGGIMLEGTALTVDGVTLRNNTAQAGGGIFTHVNTLTLTIDNTTFDTNTGTDYGGGLLTNSGLAVAEVRNSTFWNNAALGAFGISGGGAIDVFYGNVTVAYSTFANNTAVGSAGSAAGGINNGGTARLAGVVLANNTGGSGNCAGTGLVTDGYSRSSDGSCNFGNANGNADSVALASLNLGPLANNGGQTQTLLPGAGSTLRDQVPTGLPGLPACPATDQRLTARPQPAGGLCDIGAVEVVLPPTPTPTPTQTATATRSPTATANATTTATATGTATPTGTATSTSTATPTGTPPATPTPTPTGTALPTATPVPPTATTLARTPTPVIPEGPPLWLFGSGLLLLGWFGSRRRG